MAATGTATASAPQMKLRGENHKIAIPVKIPVVQLIHEMPLLKLELPA